MEFLKFREIFRFEIKYQLKKISTLIYATILSGLTLLWVIGYVDIARDLNLQVNSILIIAGMAAFPSMFALIVISGFAGDAAVRDISSRMEQILYTTSIRKTTYIAARFLALFFIVVFLMVIAIVLGIILSYFITGGDDSLYGPVFHQAYFITILFFILPNLFIGTGLVYSIVLFTKSTMAGYIGALIIFLCSAISMDLLAGPSDYREIGKLLDPSGAAILRELRIQGRDLNIGEIGKEISLIINRLLWICVSFVLLLFSFWRFNFSINHRKPIGKRFKYFSDHFFPQPKLPFLSLPLSSNSIYAVRAQQLCVLASRSFWELIKSPGTLIILIIFLILFFMLPDLHNELFGANKLPVTAALLILLDQPILHFIIAVLITLFTGHLVWGERESNLNEIFDALPLPNYIIITGKFLGLLFLLILLQFIQVATAVAVQIGQGYYEFDIPLYLQMLLGFQLFNYLLFSAVAMALHILINHKYIGHTIILLFYFYTIFHEKIGIHNDLMVFGSPDLQFSFSWDFKMAIKWVLLRLYWVSWVLLIITFSTKIMSRGMVGPGEKIAVEKSTLLRSPILIFLLSLILILAILYSFV